MVSQGRLFRRKAAEAAWRPGKAPRYLSPEKHTRPVERGRHLARTLLKFWGSSLWGPPPKIFWGIFFSGVLGFLDARRGGAGPSPPLYGPDFLTIPSQNFLESKNRVPKTYTYQSAFCKRGHSLSASAPKATEVLRCRELPR